MKQGVDETFKTNLLAKAKIKATNVRGAKFGPERMVDGEKETYFAGKDKEVKADIVFTLPEKIEFDCLMIQEVIELGHRTTKWSVEYSDDGRNWISIPEATDKQAIGHKWIVINYATIKNLGECNRTVVFNFCCYSTTIRSEARIRNSYGQWTRP